MEPVEALARAGGVATPGEIAALTSRRAVRRALAAGLIERASRTRLVLPAASDHLHAAAELTGVMSHLSAAQYWGWKVKTPPERPWVTVPRKRHLGAGARNRAEVVFADLTQHERRHGVTSPLRTVLDCARRLPFDEALAVADSALRSGAVHPDDLRAEARALRGPGRPAAIRVAQEATHLADNPFESVLRAIALDVPGLQPWPQVTVELPVGIIDAGLRQVRPDLVDRTLQIVMEADSYEFHTSKTAHDLDCERFTALGLAGWLVLRFSWEQVMLRPGYVREVLTLAVQTRNAQIMCS